MFEKTDHLIQFDVIYQKARIITHLLSKLLDFFAVYFIIIRSPGEVLYGLDLASMYFLFSLHITFLLTLVSSAKLLKIQF